MSTVGRRHGRLKQALAAAPAVDQLEPARIAALEARDKRLASRMTSASASSPPQPARFAVVDTVDKRVAARAPEPQQVRPAAEEKNDKRFAARKPDQTPGVLYFDNAVDPVACVIRDMSTTGARLELRGPWSDNPFQSKWRDVESVWLVVRSGKVMYDCRIVRRSETPEIGVRFGAAPKPFARAVR